ncbi:alpha/beta hydrolase [Paraburkholderia sp. SUR17]|uniref:alpha/beta fold hydrolase n=1 Tax=Paraburkholderia sp. SUR17 TaxID=3034358 RepID=UPI00240855E6|nr:alpha/beta hydrolase [Paraburkholderia sp. SUR17]WEY41332.1 alpha/beta hydrolase [Paraburkholderia sp. SUR17]
MNTLPVQEGWIVNDGLRLRHISWGREDAPPVVMLHGLRSYAYTWEPVAAALADSYRVIALDQRGRGLSNWDPQRNYYAEAYARDLEVLVDALGLRRFVLVGHSMGGANAFVYSGKHPERLAGLVVEDMGPGASASSQGSERIRRELRDTPDAFNSWDEVRAFWRRQRPNISDTALESRVAHSLKTGESGRIVWRHDAAGIAAARLAATPAQLVDLWPFVTGLTMPTLVLRGSDSDFLSAATLEKMAAASSQICTVSIPQATHYVHDDQLAAFNVALRAWLDHLNDAVWREGA